MTDEQIVKTLAEFMGYERVRELMPGTRFSEWIGAKVGRQFDSEDVTLPDWLTSYDAIAEVWQKSDDMLYESATHYLQNGICFDDWYSRTPRQHAEALAMAILEAKEK